VILGSGVRVTCTTHLIGAIPRGSTGAVDVERARIVDWLASFMAPSVPKNAVSARL
jgi:hypothetical protein